MKKLSKDEMKQVVGGVMPPAAVYCGYWPAPGYPMEMAECLYGTIEECTQECNEWCSKDPGCTSVHVQMYAIANPFKGWLPEAVPF